MRKEKRYMKKVLLVILAILLLGLISSLLYCITKSVLFYVATIRPTRL